MGETILLILFGWILGLFSPLIVDEIRKGRQRVEVETGIRTELNEVRLKLAGLVYLTRMHLGTFDRNLLNWIKPIAERYQGAHASEPFVQGLAVMSNLTDTQLNTYLTSQSAGPRTGLNMKKYTLPYLESKMDRLAMFPEKLQGQMLAIKAHLDLVNEEVDASRFYLQKTFDPTAYDANQSAIDENLRGRYVAAADMAKFTVDLINKLDQ